MPYCHPIDLRTTSNRFYIYRHIRCDTNTVFYVGFGTLGKKDNGYYRANATKHRTPHWKRIVANCDYIIDIVLDGLTYEQAIEKEKELIALYGRRDLNIGTLVNLTDGGEGQTGRTLSPIAIENIRRRCTGRKMPEEQKLKIANSFRGHKRSAEERESVRKRQIGNKIGLGRKKTPQEIAKIQASRGDFKHSIETKLLISQLQTGISRPKKWKMVLCISNGKIYSSVESAATDLGVFPSNISSVCLGKRKMTGKLQFRYVKENECI